MRKTNRDDYHLITTTHPYFIELGLGSFTTGTLMDWWYQKDHLGRYLNRRHFTSVSSPNETLETFNRLDVALGFDKNPEVFWYGWKPNNDVPNAGRFKKQNLYGMNGTTGGSQEDEWVYQGAVVSSMATIGGRLDYLNGIAPIVGVEFNGEGTATSLKTSMFFPPELTMLKPIYSLIQLNREMSTFEDYYPVSTWDTQDPSTHPGYSTAVAFGTWALLSEIKAAKGGEPFVQWSGEITFYVSENNGLISQCPITDWVQFKLYLTDDVMKPSNDQGPALVMKNFAFAAPKKDAIGPSPSTDGERASTDAADVANYGAGEVDMQWNPVTKKWQSGNINMFAKLVTNVPAGKAPDLNYLLSCDIKEQLENPDNKFSYIPGRGSGMPIRVQNGMPLQWSPNYAQTENQRCTTGNKDKQFITVYNFNPRKAFPSGEEVLLTQIDGIWHVSDLGKSDVPLDEGITAKVDEKWGPFTYLTTSSQFFFRGIRLDGSNIEVDPRSAELNFHKRYYNSLGISSEDNNNNGNTNYGPEGSVVPPFTIYPSGGYDFTDPFNTVDFQVWFDQPGWLQTTSFDYLDSQIFGIRGKTTRFGANTDKCSLSNNNATLLAGGTSPPDPVQEYPQRNAAYSGPFFGCVFPEGYTNMTSYINRNWTVEPTGTVDVNPLDYVVGNSAGNPFDKGDGQTARSTANVRCQSHETKTPFDPILADQDGGKWSRGTTKSDANMFYADKGKQIPADVMLNAAPNASYGSPIKPLSALNTLYTAPFYFANGIIARAIEAGVWLCKDGDPNVSALNLKPVNPLKLMFKPLKLEAYLQFGLPDTLTYGQEVSHANNLDLDFCQDDIRGFWTEIARTQTDGRFPISYHVPIREFQNTRSNLVEATPGSMLKWGAWTKYKQSYNNLHTNNYWLTSKQGALNWTTIYPKTDDYKTDPSANWNGAGAFGVIGTNIKVYANTEIQFTTSNLYGMGADNRHVGMPTDPNTQPQAKSWGNSDTFSYYKKHNVPDLSVRIYQGHPSDSTLYDPRYFAVHHFNPGVRYTYDSYYGVPILSTNRLLVNEFSENGFNAGGSYWRPRNYLREIFQNLRDDQTRQLAKVYYFYPQASGVDIKIPSRYAAFPSPAPGQVGHVEGGSYHPVPISNNTLVFADATYDNGVTLQPKLMDAKYWVVDTKRTGKLLPYKYTTSSLGLPINNGQNVTITDEKNAIAGGKSAIDVADNLIIKNYGKGYKENDGLGNLDYGYLFKVTATGVDGSIAGLQCIGHGTGIPLTFAAPTGIKIGNFTSRMTLQSLTGNGEGFDGYFLTTKLHDIFACDKKPFLLKANGNSEVRIASPKTVPSHSLVGSSTTVEPAAIVSENQTVSYQINTALKSEDDSYDVFFHFHNDITMTWLACGSRYGAGYSQPHGDQSNIAESIDQHITLDNIVVK